MKSRRVAALALASIAAAWAAAPVRAELLDAEGNAAGISRAAPVLEDVGFITGNSTVSTAFSITASGTYTVTLTDLLFPDPFQSLALAITSATTTFGSLTEPGSVDVILDGPMQLFALVFGTPDAVSGIGLYGLAITLSDGGGSEPVPLPAGAWLLLSGLAALLARRRA